MQHAGCASVAGECTPDLDLYEAPDAFEICVDLPGVGPDSVRVLLKSGVLVIAGHKLPADQAPPGGATFHLAERSYGRFVRALQLPGAIDGARVVATLSQGELHISVPRITDRRTQDLIIPIRIE